MKPVAKEQMLLTVAADDPPQTAKVPRVEAIRGRFQESRIDRQDKRMNVGAPDRPRVRNSKLRRLELDQTEPGRSSCRLGPRRRAAHGRVIGRIAPKPFPGDERSVGLEERRIGSGIAPIGTEIASGSHQPKTARISWQSYPQFWGCSRTDPQLALIEYI